MESRRHPVAWRQLRRIADGRNRQAVGVDLQQGDVGLAIAAHQPRRESAPVVQTDLRFVHMRHDMRRVRMSPSLERMIPGPGLGSG